MKLYKKEDGSLSVTYNCCPSQSDGSVCCSGVTFNDLEGVVVKALACKGLLTRVTSVPGLLLPTEAGLVKELLAAFDVAGDVECQTCKVEEPAVSEPCAAEAVEAAAAEEAAPEKSDEEVLKELEAIPEDQLTKKQRKLLKKLKAKLEAAEAPAEAAE